MVTSETWENARRWNQLQAPKRAYHLPGGLPRRKLIFQPQWFTCYVSFREGKIVNYIEHIFQMHRISRTSNISVVSCLVSPYLLLILSYYRIFFLKLPRSHMFDRSIGGNPRISKGLKFALDSLCKESSNMARVSAMLLMVAQHCGWDNHHRHETLKSHYSSKTTSGMGCVGHYIYTLAHKVQYVSSVYPTYK